MPSKYQPLVDHRIALTFDQIEAVIGDTLPVAMRIETGLWNAAHLAYVRVAGGGMGGDPRPAQPACRLRIHARGGIGDADGSIHACEPLPAAGEPSRRAGR